MSESEQREIEEKYDLRNAPSRYSGSEAICWSIGAVTAATAMAEKKNEEISRHKQVYQEMDEVNTKVIDTLKAELERVKALAVNQDNYIKFLEKECERTATFLHVHNMSYGQVVAEEGQRLRDLLFTQP